MGRYAVTAAENAVTTAYTTAGILTAAATTRARIYDILVGQGGTPADNVVTWKAQRSTAAGTTTGVTPQPLDPADPAAIAAAGENATVEPTYTAGAELLEFPVNQRATYRWVAAPGGELVIPAIAANGIGFAVKSPAYTGSAELSTHHVE